jgi:hypothetical protein
MRKLLIVLILLFARPALAADLSVVLRTAAGKPVANAVVMVRPQGYVARGPIRLPGPYRVAQHDMQFDPFVLIVPVGAEVAFPNLDPFKHHVFSFSPAKTFELKLYGREDARTVTFDKVGVVTLGCNIHDDMAAYIQVVDTPFAAKSSATGELTITGLPPGPARVTIWHPYLRTSHNEMVEQTTIPASGAQLSETLALRPAPMRRGGY